jgi:hypothetical protein
MDDLINTNEGVVIPLFDDDEDVSVTVTDNHFASASACGI